MSRLIVLGFSLCVLALSLGAPGATSDGARTPVLDPGVKVAAEEMSVPLAIAAPERSAQAGRESGNLLEEIVGDWQWNCQVAPACRGNIYHVDTTVNLYEHRLRLYTAQPITLVFVVYRGAALTGQYTLIDQETINAPAGDRFFSSGPRNVVLEAGSYYFIGVGFSGTIIYGRRNDLPPQAVSFGEVATSVPGGTGFSYPPQPTAYNTYTGYQPMHQIVVTGTPPLPAAPGAPVNFTVTPNFGTLSAQLDWVNPCLTVGGDPLTQLTGARIYRDDTLLADLTGVQIGQPSSVVDPAAPGPGYYAYEVVPYNGAGNGETTRFHQWVGRGTGFYDWGELFYTWFDIMTVGTNTGITGDDELAGPFPLGFDFPFWPGESHDAVMVCSNGYLSFMPGDPMFMNFHVPLPASPNDIIAPYWGDFDPSSGGQIYYYNDIAHGCFIVQWNNVPCWGPASGNHTFQAILYPDGAIEFVYKELTPGVPGSSTVGIEDATGTGALELCYNGYGPFRPQGLTGVRLFNRGTAEVAGGHAWSEPSILRGPTLVTCPTALAFQFAAVDPGRVRLTLCDPEGRVRRTLLDRNVPRGEHTVFLDLVRGTHSGVYYLVADGALHAVHRLVLVR